ncbi:MAG: hypothetical protein JWR54_732 [Mucilaginibacter sp.]|nr:hypothetical protein [Mucilaginibacter sp.]
MTTKNIQYFLAELHPSLCEYFAISPATIKKNDTSNLIKISTFIKSKIKYEPEVIQG